ncbi:hypothetical protein [Pseudomonas coleopterorum]|uniref:Uncharacterized protein n=1 Tax=Pseudomonas coleopterorum TaxID=1605838 RepID=A0AAJ6MUS5_9PSED|nr:hypothetical protein [Pseudomonas coleopterorum]WNC11144.1 hypothetical protein RI108_06950 [Pseudomonas coleopterorum]
MLPPAQIGTETQTYRHRKKDIVISLERFSRMISASTHNFAHPLPAELLLASEGDLQTFDAPFDHVNSAARIVLCGITPGLQQAMLGHIRRS